MIKQILYLYGVPQDSVYSEILSGIYFLIRYRLTNHKSDIVAGYHISLTNHNYGEGPGFKSQSD